MRAVFLPVDFRAVDFRDDDFRDDDFRDDDFRALERFFGTLPPARRASDRPIAIACFRLFTLRPERPDLSVPRLRSRIAFATFVEAFFP